MSPTEASRHRIFFPAMSVLLATIVCYGFAPSYSRRPIDAPSIPVYLHAHGVAMTMQGAAVPKPALMMPGELAQR